MSKIWEFFENLGEYVYVADAETHELIYMNKKTLKSYGFQSLEEIIRLKCYEILQGNSLPCGMCNNEQLILQSAAAKRTSYQGHTGRRRREKIPYGNRHRLWQSEWERAQIRRLP